MKRPRYILITVIYWLVAAVTLPLAMLARSNCAQTLSGHACSDLQLSVLWTWAPLALASYGFVIWRSRKKWLERGGEAEPSAQPYILWSVVYCLVGPGLIYQAIALPVAIRGGFAREASIAPLALAVVIFGYVALLWGLRQDDPPGQYLNRLSRPKPADPLVNKSGLAASDAAPVLKRISDHVLPGIGYWLVQLTMICVIGFLQSQCGPALPGGICVTTMTTVIWTGLIMAAAGYIVLVWRFNIGSMQGSRSRSSA